MPGAYIRQAGYVDSAKSRIAFDWGGKTKSVKTGVRVFLNGIQIAGTFVQRPVIIEATPPRQTKSLTAGELLNECASHSAALFNVPPT
jgi:hypothetical protein